jgi:hypothetical protein
VVVTTSRDDPSNRPATGSDRDDLRPPTTTADTGVFTTGDE